jgi:phosphopantothenoylcysteine decarboxylase/phosphopantothenate--cysteine ligase
MTEAAVHFVGPQTFAAITGDHPIVGFWDEAEVSPHTDLGQWAEAVVIAPATAASVAKLAAGLSDNVLIATALAAEVPLIIAPAMHTEMWRNPATQRNVERLTRDGAILVGPVAGPLAGGDVGIGRMAEPADIFEAVVKALSGELRGWRVLVTAGGTREAIDPVRYIGNRSSGKMGNAVAVEAARRGASVTLITTAPAPEIGGLEVVSVESAQEMADAVWGHAADTDVAVMAAAVADFRPKYPGEAKLRRADGLPDIELEATPDILAGLAAMEHRPFLVGFAAEAGSLEGAHVKATTKGVDLLVGNDVTKAGSGFATETNEVTVYTAEGVADSWPLMSKQDVASRLWDRIVAARSAG